MPPKTSRDIEGQEPRKDRDREQQDAVVKDGDEAEQAERNRVHGDGEEIGMDKE